MGRVLGRNVLPRPMGCSLGHKGHALPWLWLLQNGLGVEQIGDSLKRDEGCGLVWPLSKAIARAWVSK